MNISSFKRILCISILISVVLLSGIGFSYAATSSELQQQNNNIDAQIKQKNSEIAGVKDKMTSALTQINKLNTEISTYQNEIDDLQSRLNVLDTEIVEKENNIHEQEEKYAIQKDLLDKRLIALYEAGASSYLDLLLSSDGLADFISKYYIISTIAESDQELLTKIENTKNQIAEEKATLENAKEEVQTSKVAIEGKKNALASSRNSKKALVSNLSEEEKKLQDELEEFEKDKRDIQNQLAALASKDNIKPVAPSAAGYISPLPGRTKANITTGYYAYSGHTGVDFACGTGTPIVAVKSGTVAISTALRRPNGSYKSYGEYIVIDHHDGTMTLYAHMSSRAIGAGASVAQGQTIGYVGSTGNSTGPHLHFEVRVGGRATNPGPYLP